MWDLIISNKNLLACLISICKSISKTSKKKKWKKWKEKPTNYLKFQPNDSEYNNAISLFLYLFRAKRSNPHNQTDLFTFSSNSIFHFHFHSQASSFSSTQAMGAQKIKTLPPNPHSFETNEIFAIVFFFLFLFFFYLSKSISIDWLSKTRIYSSQSMKMDLADSMSKINSIFHLESLSWPSFYSQISISTSTWD